jgi:hypothetical protein
MLWIGKQATARIVKDALRFFKPNTMLDSIALILILVPIETQYI